jgi:DNA polymerase/3'-5' exonuclease PolX
MSGMFKTTRLEDALQSAEAVRAVIGPLCLRCEIAGSIRRKVPFVGDIELVSIPDPKKLFELKAVVNSKWGPPAIGAFPSKYTRIRGASDIDLFWTTRECWGVCFFVRTGSAEFVRRGFARWNKVSGGHSHECRFHKKDLSMIDTLEETDVFKALRAPYCDPQLRQ